MLRFKNVILPRNENKIHKKKERKIQLYFKNTNGAVENLFLRNY